MITSEYESARSPRPKLTLSPWWLSTKIKLIPSLDVLDLNVIDVNANQPEVHQRSSTPIG